LSAFRWLLNDYDGFVVVRLVVHVTQTMRALIVTPSSSYTSSCVKRDHGVCPFVDIPAMAFALWRTSVVNLASELLKDFPLS
jgi:hypothetical protein